MTHPIELDLGPLTWVKNEIDLALARADESLERALDTPDAAARIQFAQTHLHQVRGALAIVGLDGLTQFTVSLDQSLAALARGERAIDTPAITLARRALATIGNYLEELTHGTADQPLRLLSLYREIHALRNTDPVSAAELFFPDLTQRPPRRQIATIELAEEARQNQLRMQRAQFQRGLLQWLRTATDAAGPTIMLGAVKSIEALHTGTPVPNLWYAGQAFLEALVHGDLPAQPEVKRLCSQLDAQLKRLADVTTPVPDRLIRELLYWISQAPARTAQQRAVRDTWHLDALIPEAGASVSATPLAPLLKSLQAAMTAAKQAWDEFAEGHAAALPRFAGHLADLAAQTPLLGRPALDRLLDGLTDFVRWLRKDPLQCTDQVAIEVATALLLADGGLQRGAPEASFSAQVADTTSRLGALVRGEEIEPAEHSPTVEAARRMQEREAVGQLSREILSSLAQVEQILDDYFRNQQKRAPLASLATPLKQIEGALTLIGDAQAIALVRDGAATVAGFASADAIPEPGQFETLAQRLSALGFYVQALQHGAANLQDFLDPLSARKAKLADEAPPITIEVPVAPPPEPLARRPAAPKPVPPASAQAPMQAALAASTPAPQIIAVAPTPEPAAPVPPPAVVEAIKSDIDGELLDIFLEEAHEVLATIGEQLELSRTSGDQNEHLTAIRRGFHTLKGSGRMVGLRELGEAAWGLEQTLNRWLQLEWPATPALHHLIADAYNTFSAWVHDLESGGSPTRDVSALATEAERLRSSDTPIAEPATPAAAPERPSDTAHLATTADEEAVHGEFAFPELARADTGEILPIAATADTGGDVADHLPLAETSLDDDWLRETSLEEPLLGGDAFEEAVLYEEPLFDLDEAPGEITAPAPALTAAPIEQSAEPPAQAGPSAFPAVEIIELPELQEDIGQAAMPAPEGEPASADVAPTDIDSWMTPIELESVSATQESWATGDDLPEEVSAFAPIESPASESGSQLASQFEPESRSEPAAELTEYQIEALDLAETAGPLEELALLRTAAPTPERGEPTGSDADAMESEAALDAEAPAPPRTDEDAVRLEDHVAPALSLPEHDEAAPVYERDVIQIGDNEISRPLYDLYLGEARHHLSVLRAELGRLETNPLLVPGEASLRAAHTLAGISGTTRIMSIQGLARALEHTIERLRDGAHPPTAEQAAVLKSSNDTLEAMLAQVAGRQMPLEMHELIEQLDGIGRTIPLETEFEAAREPEHPALVVDGDSRSPLTPALEAFSPATAATPVRDDLDAQLLPIFLEEGNELIAELHSTLRSWSSGNVAGDHAKATARLLHTLKGSARMAGAMTLGEHVHQLESRLDAARSADHDPAQLVEELVAGLDHADHLMAALTGGTTVPGDDRETAAITPESAAAPEPVGTEAESGSATATLRVRADTVDRFVNEAGEIGIARTRIAGELRTLRRSLLDLTENVIRLRNQLREVEIQADVQMQSRVSHTGAHEDDFDPLEMDRYTRLQELTRMMAESVGDVTTVQQSLLRNLDGAELALNSQARLSRDLQQALMQVRMVPFDSLADRLYRVTRQTAKDLGKRANLDLRGGRIEIDRSVLEHITAPLEHLLRNAIAHGIEDPAVRKASGKNEIGQITLSISQEGNEIAISLSDDGAGLDYGKIAARARASGLLAADEIADERRLTNLIFLPGFSTAGNVSAVSGRGVGMDVVKSETAAVGGRIDIRAAHGKGTEFRIYLPLTLAVTQALLVRAGGRSYAIPSSMIAQVLELKMDALNALRAAGGTDWQGVQFNYRYLPRLLGDRVSQPEEQRFNWVLLLRAGAQTLALHVDALRGNQEIVVKNAGPQLARIVGISGATVLGDGEIVLILNPVALASRGLAESGAHDDTAAGADVLEALEPLETSQAEYQPLIMVVDDSLTVRKITGRLLEREGYRVMTAKDGVDALERLIETVPDVILSDIEMPRMDGFDLLRNIRADERTREVPVIMITSRLADKHRQLAEKIGASEYLGKPYEEGELLGLLRSYTAKQRVMA